MKYTENHNSLQSNKNEYLHPVFCIKTDSLGKVKVSTQGVYPHTFRKSGAVYSSKVILIYKYISYQSRTKPQNPLA